MDLFANFFKFHLQTKLRAIIDELLEQPNEFTLDKLLEEDDLISEATNSNTKLIEYLSRPESLEKLVAYITDEAPEDADPKRKHKYPHVASEILGSDITNITHALIENEQLLIKLLSSLDQDQSAHPVLVGYVAKVLGALIKFDASKTLSYMKQRQGLVLALLQHVENPLVKELLLKIMGTENREALEYLATTPLVELLIAKFDPKKDYSEHESASQILVEIIVLLNSMRNNNGDMSIELLDQLESEKNLSTLFDFIFTEPASVSAIENGLTVISSMLEYHISPTYDTETTLEELPPFLRSIANRLDKLQGILKKNGKKVTLSGPVGEIAPLGFHRLKVVEFFAVLAHTNYHCITKEMMNLEVFKTCIDLFFEYPWNNFLHNTIDWLIQAVLSRDNEEVKLHLFTDCKLIEKICEASKLNDDDCAKPKGTRRGYMGHVTSITIGILNCADNTPALESILSEHEEWSTYLVGFHATLLREGRDGEGNDMKDDLMDLR